MPSTRSSLPDENSAFSSIMTRCNWINIPMFSCEDLGTKVFDFVDKFVSYTEAMSMPVKNRRAQSIMSVCTKMMKDIVMQKLDIHSLFKTLQYIVLEMALNCKERMSSAEIKKLCSLTRRQKTALKADYKSFDDGRKKRICDDLQVYHQRTLAHRLILHELSTLMETYQKSVKDETLLKSEQIMEAEKLNSEIDKEQRLKIEENLRNIDHALFTMDEDIMEMQNKINFQFSKEMHARNELQEMAGLFSYEIKILIRQRITDGTENLINIVKEFIPKERHDFLLQKIELLDIEKIVEDLIMSSGEIYMFPNIDTIDLDTNKGLPKPFILKAGQMMMASGNFIKLPPSEYYFQKPQNDLQTLTLKAKVKSPCIGFKKLTKGDRLTKLTTTDHPICYGLKRSYIWGRKSYGFFLI